MVCQRCSGLLVCLRFDELREEWQPGGSATRCINCGCVEDSVVLANRLRTPVPRRSVRHGTVRKREVVLIATHSKEYESI